MMVSLGLAEQLQRIDLSYYRPNLRPVDNRVKMLGAASLYDGTGLSGKPRGCGRPLPSAIRDTIARNPAGSRCRCREKMSVIRYRRVVIALTVMVASIRKQGRRLGVREKKRRRFLILDLAFRFF